MTTPPDDVRPTLAGDWRDDDAAILDDLVESSAVPPTPDDLPLAVPVPQVVPPPINRLLGGTTVILPGWPPQLLLPADHRRTALSVTAITDSAVSTGVSGDPGKLMSRSTATILINGQTLSLPGFTGALWATTYAADGTPATASGVVTYAVVTS